MRTTNNATEQNEIWPEDPLTAYKNFLKYAGKNVNDMVEYNLQANAMLASLYPGIKNLSPAPQELQVHAHNGDFYPLSSAESMPLYCSKLTIRNAAKANLHFTFGEKVIPGIVGIKSQGGEISENARVAYRNIVPSEFSNETQLAGPMGYHEYIIDCSGTKHAEIYITANSDPNMTPLRFVLEKCTGSCLVTGLNQTAVEKVFTNKCGPEHFKFESYLTMADKNKHDLEEIDSQYARFIREEIADHPEKTAEFIDELNSIIASKPDNVSAPLQELLDELKQHQDTPRMRF